MKIELERCLNATALLYANAHSWWVIYRLNIVICVYMVKVDGYVSVLLQFIYFYGAMGCVECVFLVNNKSEVIT